VKISFIITGLNRGGAETQVSLLAKELSRVGHSVEIITLMTANSFEAELKREGIPVFSLGMRRGRADFWAVFRLRRHFKNRLPDIVHSHMIHANVFSRVARLFVRFPTLICTAHLDAEVPERSRTSAPSWKRDWLYRASDWLSDLTTHVSIPGYNRYMAEGLSSEKKTLWVPNGVNTETFAPSPEREKLRAKFGLDKFVWLAIGRIVPQKDYGNLLNAVSRLRRKDFTVLIAGDGADRAAIEALAGKLELTESVRFLGIRSDVADLMAASDGLVLASIFESLPMVLLEAQASGLPVVATKVGGVPDFVREGETGFLVPSRAPQELAEAMERLMSLPAETRDQMGRRGRVLVENEFSIKQIAAKWEEIYRSLLNREQIKGAPTAVSRGGLKAEELSRKN
jgi:glycosyltransferase involved in cell wall biosynthesis